MTGGLQQLEDDPDISNDALLWRRISPEWWVYDANAGAMRVSSQAFQNLDGLAMSVGLAAECSEEQFLGGHGGYGIAELTAGAARHCRQGVVRHPTEAEPWHAHVVGDKKKKKKCLRAASVVLVEPAG